MLSNERVNKWQVATARASSVILSCASKTLKKHTREQARKRTEHEQEKEKVEPRAKSRHPTTLSSRYSIPGIYLVHPLDGHARSAWDSYYGVRREFLVGLGFLQSVSYIKPIPTHEKKSLWENVVQMPLFNLTFLGLGWPWVGEFVGFIVISRCVFQPNRIWYIAKHLNIYDPTGFTFPS